jgi:hypothetical protein
MSGKIPEGVIEMEFVNNSKKIQMEYDYEGNLQFIRSGEKRKILVYQELYTRKKTEIPTITVTTKAAENPFEKKAKKA